MGELLAAAGERSSCGGRALLLGWLGECAGDCLMARRSTGEETSVMLPARCVTCLCEEGGERWSMADMGMCGLL